MDGSKPNHDQKYREPDHNDGRFSYTSRGDDVIIHEQSRRAYDSEESRNSAGPYYKDERKEDEYSKDKSSSYQR